MSNKKSNKNIVNNSIVITDLLKVYGVTHEDLIEDILDIDRVKFMPNDLGTLAYSDASIVLSSYDRYIPSLPIVGNMVQLANIKEDTKVLVVGANTGYLSFLCSKRTNHIVAVENIPEITNILEKNLKIFGASAVKVVSDDFDTLSSVNDVFDVVLVEGAYFELPKVWKSLLSENGCVIGIQKEQEVFNLTYSMLIDNNWVYKPYKMFDLPYLPNLGYKESFIF